MKQQRMTDEEFQHQLEDPEFRAYVDSVVYDVEKPVDFRTFAVDEKYLNAGSWIYPKVLSDLEEMFSGIGQYDISVFIEGIGSGKTTKISLAIAYYLYRLGCMRDPQSYYGLKKNSKIAIMNMSIRATQAKEVMYEDLRELIDNSNWFKQHMKPDTNKKSMLVFPKHIFVIPGSSSETAPHGYNVFVYVLDEAAHFTKMSHIGDWSDQARNIFERGQRRRHSRFGREGMTVAITSPQSVDDLTEELFERGMTDQSIFGKKRPVWVAKPDKAYSGDYFIYDAKNHRIVSEWARPWLAENMQNPPPLEIMKRLTRSQMQHIADCLLPPLEIDRAANVQDETHLAEGLVEGFEITEVPLFDKEQREAWAMQRLEKLKESTAELVKGEEPVGLSVEEEKELLVEVYGARS